MPTILSPALRSTGIWNAQQQPAVFIRDENREQLGQNEVNESPPIFIDDSYIQPVEPPEVERIINCSIITLEETRRRLRTLHGYLLYNHRSRNGSFAYGYAVMWAMFPWVETYELDVNTFFWPRQTNPETFYKDKIAENSELPSVFRLMIDMNTGAFFGTGEAILDNINHCFTAGPLVPKHYIDELNHLNYRRL